MGAHLSSQLVRWVRHIYKSLPLSRRSKQRLASLGYRMAGPLFRGEPHYEFWRQNQRSHAPAPAGKGEVQAGDFDEILNSIRFEPADEPRVSIIVLVEGGLGHALNCVRSVFERLPQASVEIIVAADAGADPDISRLGEIQGLRLIAHPQRLGPAGSANAACRVARGQYIHLLSSNAEVGEGWLDSQLAMFERWPGCGLAGSKLLSADGLLQEAGRVVWRDGSVDRFGHRQDPSLPAYNYAKEADCCAGSSLLVQRGFWDELAGFDEHYSGTGYEAADLAFRARAKGRKVVYQPESRVIQYGLPPQDAEGAAETEAARAADQQRFRSRWADVLDAEQLPPGERLFNARDRTAGRKTVLVIDHYVPQPDLDAGSRTIWCMLRVLQSMGFNTKFCPTSLWRDPIYTSKIQQQGIEVFYGDDHDLAHWVRECGEHLAAVLVSRPAVAQECLQVVRANTPAKVIYYGHDLHYLRLLSEYEHTQDARFLRQSNDFKLQEESIWRAADVVYYPSPFETDVVKSLVPDAQARTIPPYFFDEEGLAVSLADRHRHQLMFVAGFGHAPNVDAAVWLVQQILPIVKERVPDARLLLVGSKPTEQVKALASDSVQVTGYVSDDALSAYYRTVGVAVAPMRFGAGVKGKVVEALHHALPLVTTSVGIQGLDGLDQVVPASDDARVIADAIVRLMQDDGYWNTVASGGRRYADANFSRDAMRRVFEQDITP